jgi:hypothetical protein
MFVQDLFKTSIQLKEDSPTPVLGAPPSEGSPAPTLGTPPGKGGLASTSEADPVTLVGSIGEARDGNNIRYRATRLRHRLIETDFQVPLAQNDTGQ